MKFFVKHKDIILLIAIVILATILRFYRLPEMAGYEFDQEYAVNFAYKVLQEYPLQLIGQGLSVQGLFMGPLYFYFLTPFFAITNLHPLGGYIGSILFGLTIIVAYFFIGRSIFNAKVGLIAAFLRAVLMSRIQDDWTMVPAAHSELLVIITWWLFYKYWHGEMKYLPFLGLTFGLYTSIHPILFPFYFVFIVLLVIKRKIPNLKTIILSILAFLIPQAPLVLFEYWHSFLEVKKLLSIFSTGESSTGSSGIIYLAKYLNHNFYGPFQGLGIDNQYGFFLMLILLLVSAILIIKKIGFWKDNFHLITLVITYIVFIAYYTFFPAHVPEYYFTALTTLAFLYICATLGLLTLKQKLIPMLFLILGVITIINFNRLVGSWNNLNLTSLYHKDFIVKEILRRQPKDQEFFVSYIKLPGWNFGFNYLFKYYGQIPQTIEAKPPIYSIVIPKHLVENGLDVTSGNIGLILPKE